MDYFTPIPSIYIWSVVLTVGITGLAWEFGWIPKIKIDFQLPETSSLGWPIAAFLAILLLVILAWNPVTRLIQEQGKAIESSHALIRTKPICGSTCKNLDWIIETCKRRAVEIGRLKNLSRSDAKRATRYFRGCLIDRGMNWQKCDKGEAGCMRLRYFGARWGSTELPSFIE